MGLKITSVTFVANTLLKSTDMNTNWSQMTSTTHFDGIWNTQTNASVNVTVEDATINSVNVLRVRPANGNPDRGIAISSAVSGTQTNPVYVDSSGQVNVNDATNDALNMHYYTASFFTGTGGGAYTFPNFDALNTLCCSQKNGSAKTTVVYDIRNSDGTWQVVTTDAGTQFCILNPHNHS